MASPSVRRDNRRKHTPARPHRHPLRSWLHVTRLCIWLRVRQMWPAYQPSTTTGTRPHRCALQACILFVCLMLPHHFCPILMTLMTLLGKLPNFHRHQTSFGRILLLYTHTRPIFTGYSGRYRSVRTHAALTGRSYDTGGCPIPSVPWHRSFVMCSRTRSSDQAYQTHRGEPPPGIIHNARITKSVRLLFLSSFASGHKNSEGRPQSKKRNARIGIYATGLHQDTSSHRLHGLLYMGRQVPYGCVHLPYNYHR